MQSELQSSFERVEQALQRLTDSIAAYNPSTTAAEELAAADDAVAADLKRLVTHQTNSARLSALRAQTSSLDADIKSKIRQLAETRKELQNIPAYDTDSDSLDGRKEINVQELLRYAKFISKTSVPPTVPKMRAEPAKVLEGVRVKKELEREGEGKEVKMVNGTSSPAPAAPEGEAAATTTTTTGGEGEEETETATIHALTKGHRTFINQTLRFEPWPEHLTIQRGALGAIQRLVDAGVDPGSVLSAEEKEARQREEEEQEKRQKEDRERKEREGGGGGRRGSMRQGGGGQGGSRGREEVFNPDDM